MGLSVYSFDGPVVCIAMLNSALSGGSSVTVSGLSFGSVELTASGLVAGGGCSTASWMSSTSVSCVSGSASGQLGTSSVTVGAVAGTGLSVYSFDGPVVCIAMVNSASSGGSAVTVSGLSFGSVDLTASGLVAGGGCSTASWSSRTSVSCVSGSGIGQLGTSSVTVGAVAG